MKRRNFMAAAAVSLSAANSQKTMAATAPSIFELRYFRLRNGAQLERTNGFLNKHFLPAVKRAGAGPVGFFAAVIAQQSPFVLAVTSYKSLDDFGAVVDKMNSDEAFGKASDEYNSITELSYIRMESALFRGFSTMPAIEVPPVNDGQTPRIFELRTYEANNVKASRRKIGMFDNGEIAIFRKCKMTPVFFGEALVGTNLPNLTYMLAFDNMAQREEAWRTFVNHPEWAKLKAQPGLADAEIVSNISNAILRPTPYSPIR
jgi:hypothetical protein